MVTTAKRRADAPQAPGNVEHNGNVERLRKLYELSMTLCGDPATVFARIAPMIGELLEVPIVCLSQIVGDELHFLSVYDRGNVVSNAGRCPLSVTPCATVAQSRDLRVYDRVAERFPEATFLKENNAVSYCGFPSLDNGGKVVAVTCLLDDRPHDFTPDDRHLLRVFGQRIGMEIERQKHLDESDRVVSALGEAEAKYRRIFENADEGMFQSTPEGRFISANPALARMLGYDSPDELMNGVANIGEQLFVDPEERTKCMANLASHGQFRGKEVRWRRKDGTVVWLSESAHQVRGGDGAVLYYQGSVADITGRKMAENALRDSEERFRDFAEGASDWFWEMDSELRFTYHSERYFEITGFRPEDKIGTTRTRYVNSTDLEVDAEKWTAHLADIEARKPFKNFEYSFIAGDDRVLHVAISGTPAFDPDGNFLGYRGTGSDITDRRMAENALRDSEERVRDFAETASDWFWEMDGNLRFTYFSNRYGSVGLEADERIGKTRIETTADDVDHGANRRKWRDHLADLEARRAFKNFEHTGWADDGRLVHISVSGKPVFDEAGHFMGYRGTATDITARKKTESALRDSEAQYRNLIGGSIQGVLIHRDRKPVFANQAHADIFGYDDPEEIVALPSIGAFEAASERERLLAYSAARLRGETAPTRYEFEGVRKDGTHIWLENFVTYVDWGGEPAIQSTTIDITDRKRAETALRDSEGRVRDFAETASDWFWEMDGNLRFTYFSDRFDRSGFGSDERIGKTRAETTAEDTDQPKWRQHLADLEARRPFRNFEHSTKAQDGSLVHISISGTPIFDEAGDFNGYRGTGTDITARKRAEEKLRESEARLRTFIDHSPTAISLKDRDGRFVLINRFHERIIGKLNAEVVGKTSHDLFDKAFADAAVAQDKIVLDEGRAVEWEGKLAFEGGVHTCIFSKFPVRDATGSIVAIGASSLDITERKRAEQELKESEERLSQAAKLAKLGHWVWEEKQNRVERFSPELARIFGLGDGATIVSFADFLAYVHRDDRHLVETVIQQARRDHSGFEVEYRIKGRDGETRHVVERSEPVLDEAGELVRSVSTIQDITEIKQAEEQLRHAQKMEAVGQLTGGVAHDFNNLLAVILGHAELLQDRLGADDPSVRAVSRTAARGAELTQRLLAFSRRQSLEPEVMDLDALIAGMTELLRRTLGETIEIEVTSEAEPWQTLADPGQVENALLNLAINARDAMPEGGRLTIATDNVTLDGSGTAGHADAGPGDYVRLTVADTGTGMAAEVLERAFEPFFTTKGVGEGSGLGLPMVYGFAKQSGGFVLVGSEEDRGTTVELYLPRAKIPDRYAGDRREEAEPKGRGESILVIEDDPDVRQLATSMLDSLGYRVLEAESAKAALEMLDGAEGIDLMLADVVLSGGMSGPCLADEVRHRHPDIKVLFMSGYADKDIAERCSPCAVDGVLGKPFPKRHLAHKVRAVLDGSSA